MGTSTYAFSLAFAANKTYKQCYIFIMGISGEITMFINLQCVLLSLHITDIY